VGVLILRRGIRESRIFFPAGTILGILAAQRAEVVFL